METGHPDTGWVRILPHGGQCQQEKRMSTLLILSRENSPPDSRAAVLCTFSWGTAVTQAAHPKGLHKFLDEGLTRQIARCPLWLLLGTRCFLTCCQLHSITNPESALWTTAFGMMKLHQVSPITIFKLDRTARHLTTPPTLLPRSYLWIKEWCYHCAAIQILWQCPDAAVLLWKSVTSRMFQASPPHFPDFCARSEVTQLNRTRTLGLYLLFYFLKEIRILL